jgi:hypothetical protein
MRRLASATVLTAFLLLSASIASAGTYVSLGMGGTPDPQGELKIAASTGAADVPQRKAALGWSIGRFAVEATAGRYALGGGHATAAGVQGRLSIPLDGNFGAYGRFGVERAWLSDLDARLGDTADGWVGGLGLEYKIDAPLLGQAAIWAELTQDQLTFADDTKGGSRMWTLGASLGF